MFLSISGVQIYTEGRDNSGEVASIELNLLLESRCFSTVLQQARTSVGLTQSFLFLFYFFSRVPWMTLLALLPSIFLLLHSSPLFNLLFEEQVISCLLPFVTACSGPPPLINDGPLLPNRH